MAAPGVDSDSLGGAEAEQRAEARAGPGHSHLKRPLVNPLKLRTDAAAYPNGTCLLSSAARVQVLPRRRKLRAARRSAWQRLAWPD